MRCALVTGVHACALPICQFLLFRRRLCRDLRDREQHGGRRGQHQFQGHRFLSSCFVFVVGSRQVVRAEPLSGRQLSSRFSIRVTTASSAMTNSASTSMPENTPVTSNRSEEHTSELQSLIRKSYAVFCLKKKKQYNS